MKRHHVHTLLLSIAFLMAGFAGGVYVGAKRGVPFVMQKEQWSIGIYTGESPFLFDPRRNKRNPRLTAEDVTDVPAKFVADPFLVREDSTWYLLFEAYNTNSEQGDIAVAKSDDARRWKYDQVVLDEPFHLSYPYVFEWQNDYYMIPESFEANSIRLYKAAEFPYGWSFVGTLVEGREFLDPSIVHFGDKWWIFVSETGNDTLRLYYAADLMGSWHEHPKSPIVSGDKNVARPGGRVLEYNSRLFRYAQDGDPTYGNRMWAFEITELTTSSYREEKVSEDPVLQASGSGWNEQAMHHIDPQQIGANKWIASVDGFGTYLVFGLEY